MAEDQWDGGKNDTGRLEERGEAKEVDLSSRKTTGLAEHQMGKASLGDGLCQEHAGKVIDRFTPPGICSKLDWRVVGPTELLSD